MPVWPVGSGGRASQICEKGFTNLALYKKLKVMLNCTGVMV